MLGGGVYLSRAVSVVVAVSVTWYLNRRFVFRTSGVNRRIPEYSRHVIAQGGGLIVNLFFYLLLLQLFDALKSQPLVPLAIGSGAALVVNYLGAKFWTFRHRGDHGGPVDN